MPLNRLAEEKSPYLLQHKNNPVDWFPWGDEAFQKARNENKPIFLSIGYSTCHWCHVMERESFESEPVAALLNANFISIKVDREERPDVDAVYMSVVQAMTGSGGWPMTLFLTPDLKPFFAGTYFPPTPAHGRPSFSQLVNRIHELWTDDREALLDSSIEITNALRSIPAKSDIHKTGISKELLDKIYHHFEQTFDRTEGGFGGAPKFPRPVQLNFLFNYYKAFGKIQARDMALFTLRKMALGGMHDHLGGGFHRYSVDRYWRISHFEKMLYDQAQLIHSYLDAWQITHDPFFRDVVVDTIEYVLRDMTHSDGAFFSAEDADSEGEEGKFYAWTLSELKNILGLDAEPLAEYYGVTPSGNFEHGTNVFYIKDEPHSSLDFLLPLKERLLKVREGRIRPLRDDKVLTSWNGLMIGAMARAGKVLQELRFTNAAVQAAGFIWDNLRPDGRLLHRWRNGEARFDGYLDDYAFLINGYLDLYEATFDVQWIKRSLELQEEQDQVLYDAAGGGYFNAREAPDLILQWKSDYDGAEPSGNSIAVHNLFRLAIFTEEDRFKDRAEATLRPFVEKIEKYPYAMPELMTATLWLLQSPLQIVFSGEDNGNLKSEVNDRYLPMSITVQAEHSPGPFTRTLLSNDGHSAVYVCQNFVCQLPITEPKKFGAALDKITY